MRSLSTCLSLAFVFAAPTAWSQTIGEAALRSALQLAQTPECDSATNPFSVVALPLVDASQSLSENQIEVIRSNFLSAFSSELPSCARLTDAVSAFATISFMTELDNSGRLTESQRIAIEETLQNAHSVVALKINRMDEQYQVTVSITSINDGHSISDTRYYLPKPQTTASCGGSAVSEQLGLVSLADNLVNGIHPIQGLHIATALYQHTDQSLDYGSYITQQLLGRITTARNAKLFATDFPVRLSDNPTDMGPNEYAVSIRYWICETTQSARIVVSAASSSGEAAVFTQTLSLKVLPSGMSYLPPSEVEVQELDEADTSTVEGENAQSVGIVNVSPVRVTTGDILTVSAEPPASCNPFFFDLASGGQLTPIPLHIFDVTEAPTGLERYDNTSESKYGITIQDEDERGMHRLGFVCRPSEVSNQEIREVFQELRAEITKYGVGAIEIENTSIIFNTSLYEIIQ